MKDASIDPRPNRPAHELTCDFCGGKPARFVGVKYGRAVEGYTICSECEKPLNTTLIPIQPPMSGQLAEHGWICPRCQRVNAPWMAHCDCPIPTTTRSSDKEYADG